MCVYNGRHKKIAEIAKPTMTVMLKCTIYTRVNDMLETLNWFRLQGVIYLFEVIRKMLCEYMTDEMTKIASVHG